MTRSAASASAPTTTSSRSATPAEVVARVKAVLRRSGAGRGRGGSASAVLEVDLAAHEVLVAGRPVRMTAREFELLRVLVQHPRQVFSREQLFELVWGSYGDRSAVSVYISRLREKIERRPDRSSLHRHRLGRRLPLRRRPRARRSRMSTAARLRSASRSPCCVLALVCCSPPRRAPPATSSKPTASRTTATIDSPPPPPMSSYGKAHAETARWQQALTGSSPRSVWERR